MNRSGKQALGVAILAAVLWTGAAARSAAMESGPETVIVTYRPKAGDEAALLEVLSRQWAALRSVQAVEEQPHLVYRSTEKGKPVLTEVFTWASADDADHVPPEVQALWGRMQSITEARDGRPGVEIHPVEAVDTAKWK